jgi:transcriptional regulator with XRE-family HTH domain
MKRPRTTSKPRPFLKELGQRIATARRTTGLSQEAFAAKAGLHRTYQGMLERGERNPTVENVLRVCGALGIKPGQLLDDLPEVPPKDID